MPDLIIPQLEGASVFAIPAGTKKANHDWQNNPQAPGKDDNYGVHCGKSGFVVIDLDVNHGNNADGIATFKGLCPDGQLPETFTVSTPSGGLHLYFKGDMKRHPNTWPGVDVLGGSGYVVGPGSTTDKGTYQVVSDRPVAWLPDWLRDKIEARLGKQERQQVHEVKTGSAAYQKFTDALVASGSQTNGTNWQCPAHDDDDPSMTVTDAGDRVLAFCHAGCDYEQILSALGLDSADGFDDRKEPADWGVERLTGKQLAEQRQEEAKKSAESLFTFKTGAELDDTPFVYRIEGLLPAKCNVLFSAYRKAGKTSTMLNLSKALTTKERFFGEFRTDRVEGRVVYLNFELDEQMFRKYMEDNRLDLDNPRLVILNLRGKVGQFRILDETFRNCFAELLREQECEVLIVDPLSTVMSRHGQDSDNNDAARMVLEMFTEVQALADIDHIIVVDHTGHENKGRVRGASGKEDWADVLWVQEKNGSDLTRKFKAEGRGVDESSFIISRTADGTIETQVPPDADGGDWRMILAELSKGTGPSQTELAKLTGIAPETLRRRLKEHDGEIERHDMRGTKAKALYLRQK